MKLCYKILIALVIILLVGGVTMLLWNALLPDIFGLPKICYLQGLGIFCLSRLLFGGHGHEKEKSRFHRKYWGDNFLGRMDWLRCCEDEKATAAGGEKRGNEIKERE
ncbi:MAG: hypothetical protein LBD73_00555 [Deferribacteraceae bacterium]|nr:hypothetical protein [Deferribacteraceae bacterium]